MIRFILEFLFLFVYLLVSIFVLLFCLLVGLFNKKACNVMIFRFVTWGFRCVTFFSGVKLTVIGEENIPDDRPVLFIGNHRSIFDIVITYGRMKHLCGFVSKKENKNLPVISLLMRHLYCEFLDRDDIRNGMQMILNCIDHIKNGVSVFIYPEGTRNKTNEPLIEYHAGSFKIAEKSGCTIIPVTVNHTEEIFENQFPRIRPAHVVLEYGAPVETASLSRDEKKQIPAKVMDIIKETYLRNQEITFD
ncbi:MAG: 1-acyl-sn-glycerol-3-phosphate acyltransferase [Lachnospiraceae bacterium]|nr:1-acyl-sn-glycerol-3-phosphate acyltransferase [Lachnospiraceae bacterium]